MGILIAWVFTVLAGIGGVILIQGYGYKHQSSVELVVGVVLVVAALVTGRYLVPSLLNGTPLRKRHAGARGGGSGGAS